jgi:hypothetical protein
MQTTVLTVTAGTFGMGKSAAAALLIAPAGLP